MVCTQAWGPPGDENTSPQALVKTRQRVRNLSLVWVESEPSSGLGGGQGAGIGQI